MNKLTQRQQEVLDFIADSQAQSGLIPSTREIQKHFGFSSQTAAINHLRALERKGVIQKADGRARAAVPMSQLERRTIIDVPLYGQIAAGYSETTEQDNQGLVSIDAASIGLRRGQRVFALKVRGDSMIGAGIYHGDLVVLENRPPVSGAVVAALIDGETTLKRYVVERERPFLHAENPLFPDLIPIAELIIQGVLVGLIRKF